MKIVDGMRGFVEKYEQFLESIQIERSDLGCFDVHFVFSKLFIIPANGLMRATC